jgi:hypothetical protein
MARCWVSEASDAASPLGVWGWLGFLLFDFFIVDASIHPHASAGLGCRACSRTVAWLSGVGVSVCFVDRFFVCVLYRFVP